jgi:hypothetical protein
MFKLLDVPAATLLAVVIVGGAASAGKALEDEIHEQQRLSALPVLCSIIPPVSLMLDPTAV